MNEYDDLQDRNSYVRICTILCTILICIKKIIENCLPTWACSGLDDYELAEK